VHGNQEVGKSSTWRELKAVARTLKAFGKELYGKQVKVCSDNKGVEAFMKKGSMKLELQNLSMDIMETCNENHIRLFVQWIPR
jgi:intein-encoded DNA endonuclease-like protein